MRLSEALAEIRGLLEKHKGVDDLKVPADCSYDDIEAAAEKDLGGVEQGGNHATVRDRCGKIASQIPRHRHLNPNTCRSIVKALQKAKHDDDKCEPGGVHQD